MREVRIRQQVSLRTMVKRLGSDKRSVLDLEDEPNPRLADLCKYAEVLSVPVSDLLPEVETNITNQLSDPIAHRSAMLRLFKTARSILESTAALKNTAKSSAGTKLNLLAQNLNEQILALCPEFKDVSSWHTVGHRRSLDELGRIADNPLPYHIYEPAIGKNELTGR